MSEPHPFWPDMDGPPTTCKCRVCKNPFQSRAKNVKRCPKCRGKVKKASSAKSWVKRKERARRLGQS